MITAESLSEITNLHEITDFIKNQLQLIDDILINTKRSIGRTVVPIQMPAVFDGINSTDYESVRFIVYRQIIASLEKRGFEIKIKLDVDPPMMYVIWNSKLKSNDLATCQDYVRARAL